MKSSFRELANTLLFDEDAIGITSGVFLLYGIVTSLLVQSNIIDKNDIQFQYPKTTTFEYYIVGQRPIRKLLSLFLLDVQYLSPHLNRIDHMIVVLRALCGTD